MGIVTINGIPVFDAVLADDDCRFERVSLVDSPATMSDFFAFAEKHPLQMYAVTDEDKHLVRGVLMRADFPVYRRDEAGEYYIIFCADEIRKYAAKYLAEGRSNLVNRMHEAGTDTEGVEMVQYFIKGDGVSVDGFPDIADGSLFAEYHITNEEVWQKIKAGEYKGFSLEFTAILVPEQDAEQVLEDAERADWKFRKLHRKMGKVSRMFAELAKCFAEFASVATDGGVLVYDAEELAEGVEVMIQGEDGQTAPAPDGEYATEDRIIVVMDGKVSEIKDKEQQPEAIAPDAVEEVAEEGAEEAPAPEVEEAPADEEDNRYADLDNRLAKLEERLDAIEALVAGNAETFNAFRAEMDAIKAAPLAAPAHEEFQKVTAPAKGDNRASNLMNIIKAGK